MLNIPCYCESYNVVKTRTMSVPFKFLLVICELFFKATVGKVAIKLDNVLFDIVYGCIC